MKIFLTALAACALVACSGEPNEQSDTTPTDTTPTDTTPTDTNIEAPADSGAAKAQVVSLKITGMT